jgi:hypothetical protein
MANRSYPVGSAQQKVLDALGLTAADHSEASRIFENLGITVSSRREGRASVPVVREVFTGGGFNAYGEGEEVFGGAKVDLSKVSQWMK